MSNFTNQLGNWNPQLLREFRGRLKLRSVVAAVVLSAIAQILLLLLNLPEQSFEELTLQEKWLNLWTTMTWLFSYALYAIGSYYLVSDLTQEEQRGTLNFIRLTPYPAWKILLGKLLGVPVLPYLTIALAVPLHLVATIQAGLPLTLLLSYYVLLLAGCVFWYSLAMLYGLAGGVQIGAINRQATTAIAFTAIALFAFTPLFLVWNISVIWQWMGTDFTEQSSGNSLWWFYIQLTDNIGFAHLFTLASLGIGTALIWSILLRRFRQPRSTLLSKRQSYLIVALLEGFFLGFFVSDEAKAYVGAAAIFMAGFSAVLILVLTLSICPRRQALIDWSRYQSHGWQSQIWMNKSPIAIAVLIQILTAAALLLPWLIVTKIAVTYPLSTAIAFLSVADVLLIYGVLIQIIFASKIRNPLVWTLGALIIGTGMPPTILSLLSWLPQRTDGASFVAIWTFFGYPLWNYSDRSHLLFAILGVVLQWVLLTGLLLKFRQTLRYLNVSTSQSIEANH